MRDQRPHVQRVNVTVAQLAAELGRTVPRMYDLCNAQQVYARGPHCEISPSNADRLREAHADYERRREILQRVNEHGSLEYQAARAATRSPFAQVTDDPEIATIARNLGVRPPRQTRPRRPPADPPLGGTAGEAARHWKGISRERAQQIGTLWTSEHLFTPAEAAAWWSPGGLRSDDAALAAVLRENGITPDHMWITVRGETIRNRLIEQRMAPERIARILRDAGKL